MKIIIQIHLCVDLSSIIFTALKHKMLCTEQLTVKLCPVFYSVRLAHKTNTCFTVFRAACENFRHVLSMKSDDLPLSNMVNTETNVVTKSFTQDIVYSLSRKKMPFQDVQ